MASYINDLPATSLRGSDFEQYAQILGFASDPHVIRGTLASHHDTRSRYPAPQNQTLVAALISFQQCAMFVPLPADTYFSWEYSPVAFVKTGMSGSASFQRV